MSKIDSAVWSQSFSTQTDSLTLSALDAKHIVLFFYPKDNTPGCSNEVQDFNGLLNEFSMHGVEVIGVSRDSVKSHQKFAEKFSLHFPLISDPDETLCRALDVIKEKNMFGKIGFGIERSTFILTADGEIVNEWRKVKVPGHANEVLEAVKAL